MLDWKKPFILFSVSVLVDGNSTPRVAKTRQSIIKAVAITMKSAKKSFFENSEFFMEPGLTNVLIVIF